MLLYCFYPGTFFEHLLTEILKQKALLIHLNIWDFPLIQTIFIAANIRVFSFPSHQQYKNILTVSHKATIATKGGIRFFKQPKRFKALLG